MTNILIWILLGTAVMLLMVALLMLKVIRVYVQESTNPTPFATAEEKEQKRLTAEKAAEGRPKPRSLWNRIMGLKPISEEKDLMMEHTFDGITELDNPTPAWFMVLFYGTIIFGVIYLFNYDILGWGKTQEEEYIAELEQAENDRILLMQKPGGAAKKINEDNVEQSTESAVLLSGATLYKTACSPCHGEHGEGSVGPNLTDEYWIHGGSIKDIFKTIKYGVPDKGMIAWEKSLSPKQISELSSYILSLQGSNPVGAKAPQGEK